MKFILRLGKFKQSIVRRLLFHKPSCVRSSTQFFGMSQCIKWCHLVTFNYSPKMIYCLLTSCRQLLFFKNFKLKTRQWNWICRRIVFPALKYDIAIKSRFVIFVYLTWLCRRLRVSCLCRLLTQNVGSPQQTKILIMYLGLYRRFLTYVPGGTWPMFGYRGDSEV